MGFKNKMAEIILQTLTAILCDFLIINMVGGHILDYSQSLSHLETPFLSGMSFVEKADLPVLE